MNSLFFSYSHKDEVLRDQLETQLTMLIRQGVISTWHDRRLFAGDSVDDGINGQLERADIILLLVSPDFLASEYCYGREMTRALERHEAGEARVIPVILRPCEWHHAPFGKLLAAPKDGRPVTKWADQDEAFLDITSAIRNAARKRDSRASPSAVAKDGPRAGTLRVPKTFTDRDRDRFAGEAYESMARFFESSLDELSAHHPGIGVAFKRIDATRFTVSVGRSGVSLGRCTVRLGRLGSVNEITISRGADAGSTNYHERLLIEAGEEALVLKATRNAMFRGATREKTLTPDAAAEYYWQLFLTPMFEDMPLSGLGAPDRTDSAPATGLQMSVATSVAASERSPENFSPGVDLDSAHLASLQAQTPKPLVREPTEAPLEAPDGPVMATGHAVPERVFPNVPTPASETGVGTPETVQDRPLEGALERDDEEPSRAEKPLEPFSVVTEPQPSGPPRGTLNDGVPEAFPQVEEDKKPFAAAETAAALYNCGMRYELGLGVLPDLAKARECYIRAARKGQRDAMNSLGLLYEQGEGVFAPNLEKARVWFRLAVRHNSGEARENLARFEN